MMAYARMVGIFLLLSAGGAQAMEASPQLVIYWRSDCAPCMQELKNLPTIARKNPGMTIELVALRDDAKTQQLTQYLPENVQLSMADEATKNQMRAYGNPSMALPFNVALHADGSLCQTHRGLLGTVRAKDWAAQC